MYYYIKSEKGYWLKNALGYTQSKQEAGFFSLDDMRDLNLDECTLEKASSLASKIFQASCKCWICKGRGLNEVVASPSHLMDVKCERCNGTGKQQGVA